MRISDWSSDVCSSDLAGVSSLHTIVPCRSMAEADAAEAALTQREEARSEQSERARADAREAALDKARDTAERDVISARESSEERRVGKECVSPCSSRGSPYH